MSVAVKGRHSDTHSWHHLYKHNFLEDLQQHQIPVLSQPEQNYLVPSLRQLVGYVFVHKSENACK